MSVLSAIRPRRAAVALLVVVLALSGYLVLSDARETTVTAYFQNADGLYKGDDVKVLGVPVGEVTGIHPEDSAVRVTIAVAGGQKIPAGAHAAIVAPSLVSGRFVQLSPAYTGGRAMSDGQKIALSRTAVPVSFDDVKQQLTDLSTALAPQGSSDQPLRQTIQALDANLRNGNSAELSSAVKGLRDAASTLSDGRSDLFTTIANLNSFTQNLAVNDAAVTGFTRELSSVSTVLATNRRQLTRAIASLAQALGTTGDFLTDNRARIRSSAEDLNLLSAALADRSNELAGVLHIAPTALIDLYNVMEDQAITGRASLTGLTDGAQLICGALLGAGGTAQQCRDALAPLVNLLKLGGIGQKTTATAPGAPQGSAGASGAPGSGGLQGVLGGLTALLPGLLGTNVGGNQ
jgi:phospholipid/cholesterol/gamma-HCH transport system substrate-binding protein